MRTQCFVLNEPKTTNAISSEDSLAKRHGYPSQAPISTTQRHTSYRTTVPKAVGRYGRACQNPLLSPKHDDSQQLLAPALTNDRDERCHRNKCGSRGDPGACLNWALLLISHSSLQYNCQRLAVSFVPTLSFSCCHGLIVPYRRRCTLQSVVSMSSIASRSFCLLYLQSF
jgi:hypothetical protein